MDLTITVPAAEKLRDSLELVVDDLKAKYPEGLPHIYERVADFYRMLDREVARQRFVGSDSEYEIVPPPPAGKP